jgi:hypothetical protein
MGVMMGPLTRSNLNAICGAFLLFLFFVGEVQALLGHNVRTGRVFDTVNSGKSVLNAATMMPPADLTPAVDKFVRLPESDATKVKSTEGYTMSAKGPVPDGPDPFKFVANELSPLSEFVKEMVVSENPVLTMAASHFFEKVSVNGVKLVVVYSMSATVTVSSPRFR